VILIQKALREMGYAPGRDLLVEVRYGESQIDRLPDLARELVRLRMDVIVAISASTARAVKAATSTIPMMSYGSSLAGTTRRVAVHVDRLFKGARPGDLPVEQPAECQLVINLKTARALGLALPPSLVARADRIVD
jgi:ABC-type uncharacterized transport system substrate-binding protein